MSRARFIIEMVRWLNAHVAPAGVTIHSDTPLFVRGVMDSIRVLELIAYTERAIGSTIPDSRMRMDNFHTVARIAEVFIEEAGNVAA
jgi:acyl carrier protein